MEIFSAKEEAGIHIVTMPMIMDHKNIHLFDSAKVDWLKSSCTVHVMDLGNVVAIMPSAHPCIIEFHKDLQKREKDFFSIHTPENLAANFKRDGLYSIFNPVESLEVVHRISEMKKTKKEGSRSRILADIINSFIGSIDETFKTNVGLDPIAEPPYLKKAGDGYLFDIGARLEIEIENFHFSVALQFDRKVFENVFDYYVDRDHHTSPENLFSNIDDLKRITKKILTPIFSMAKMNLKEKNRLMSKQNLPQILIGERLIVHCDVAAIVVEFLTAAGPFQLEVAILTN